MSDASKIQIGVNTSEYLNSVAFTLLFYDYLLTFEWETSRYWGAKITWPVFLFFVNRYATLLGNIPVVIQYFWTAEITPEKALWCIRIESYHRYFLVVTQLLIGVILVVRTYALYERSKRVLAFMLAVSAVGIGLGLWTIFFTPNPTSAHGPDNDVGLIIGCTYGLSANQSVSLIITWSAMLVFDCMIFSLTLYRAITRRESGFRLLNMLLRDGTVMVLSNTSNILTYVVGTDSLLKDYTRGVVTTFTNIICSIMISRLMLNLRDPALASRESTEDDDELGELTTYMTFNGQPEPPQNP
ncbi:hypothetical protein DFH09DRAFT_1120974 [Mycena vulgaris]|nr:hypothetical protein DFH09DRAFT_1120974 [Mycena vulgaris]